MGKSDFTIQSQDRHSTAPTVDTRASVVDASSVPPKIETEPKIGGREDSYSDASHARALNRLQGDRSTWLTDASVGVGEETLTVGDLQDEGEARGRAVLPAEIRDLPEFKAFSKEVAFKKIPKKLSSWDFFEMKIDAFDRHLKELTQAPKVNDPSTPREVLFVTVAYLDALADSYHGSVSFEGSSAPGRFVEVIDGVVKSLEEGPSDKNTRAIVDCLTVTRKALKAKALMNQIAEKVEQDAALPKQQRPKGEGHDEREVRLILTDLERSVLKDKRVTHEERVLLHALSRLLELPIGDEAYLPGHGLSMVAEGNPVYSAPGKKAYVSWGEYPRLSVYPNYGQVKYTKDNMPQRYTAVGSHDPRIGKRNTDNQCYSFALSSSPDQNFEVENSKDEVMKNYRPLDLSREKARPGDLVVYLATFTNTEYSDSEPDSGNVYVSSPHMAIVGSVDKNGKPVTAISKMGMDDVFDETDKRPILEHPIAQATLQYGTYYAIFRRKSE